MIRRLLSGVVVGKRLGGWGTVALVLAGMVDGRAAAQSFTGIGDLLPNPPFSSSANAVSPDGTKVTGQATVDEDPPGMGDTTPNTRAFVWTAGGGMTGLNYLPTTIFYATAGGITNGGVVAGFTDALDEQYNYNAGTPVRWDAAGNPTDLAELELVWNNDSYTTGTNIIDGSGNIIVAYATDFDEGQSDRGIVWVNNVPMPLNYVNVSEFGPNLYLDYMYANGVNTPGTHIVGTSHNFSSFDDLADTEAALWTDPTAQWTSEAARTPVGLGYLPGINPTEDQWGSGASDVSNNGQLIVGFSENGSLNPALPSTANGYEAHVGFIVAGVPGGVPNPMAALPDLGANDGTLDLQFASASAVNGNATVGNFTAVGWGYNGIHDAGGTGTGDDLADGSDIAREALIWTQSGVQNIEALAAGLGLNLAGWDLQEANAISDNGRVIVGWGFNPQGNQEGWVLTLPNPQIPGDFNNSGAVNGADFAKWTGDFGPGNGSDANGDGRSDGKDFLIWQANFNPAAATVNIDAVPEPVSLAMVAACWPLMNLARRRRTG